MQWLAGALSPGCSCAGIKDCCMEGFSYLWLLLVIIICMDGR